MPSAEGASPAGDADEAFADQGINTFEASSGSSEPVVGDRHDEGERPIRVGGWIVRYEATWPHSTPGYRTPNQMDETHNLTARALLQNAC